MNIGDLYEKYGQELERTMIQFCGQVELAKDGKQQAFLKGVMYQKQLEQMPEKAAKAWLFTTCRNHIIDEIRKKQKTTFFNRESFLEGKEEINYSKIEMEEFINTLSSPRKEIIILRYYNRLNASEIGEILHIEPSTVRYYLSQGIKELRKKME